MLNCACFVFFFFVDGTAPAHGCVRTRSGSGTVSLRPGAEDRRAKKDFWSCDGEDESLRRRRDQARREWYKIRDKRRTWIAARMKVRAVEIGDRRTKVSDRRLWKTAIQKRGEKTFRDPTFEERQMEEKGRGRFWLKPFLFERGVYCFAL